jgi:hypothetical protein
MEGNGSRKLGWIAIALGGLALFVALSGRMQMHGGRYSEPHGYNRPQNFQAGPGVQGQVDPQGQFDPRGQFGPDDQAGPRGQFGPQGKIDPRGQFGPRHGFEGRMHWGGPRHGFPFFFLPFILIGGLMKIAFVVLLVWLGLRLIRGGGSGPWGRGGGGRGPWGRGPDSRSDQDPPNKPGSEQPPYTGETQQM